MSIEARETNPLNAPLLNGQNDKPDSTTKVDRAALQKTMLHHSSSALNTQNDRDEAVEMDEEGNLILINVGKLDSSSKAPAQIAAFTFLIYVVSGLIVGMHYEGWNFQTTVYFIVVTLTTVGYGDYTFQHMNSWFDAVFVLVGVVFVGAAFGVIADFLWTRAEDAQKASAESNDDNENTDSAPSASDIESDLAAIWSKMYRSLAELMAVLILGACVFVYLERNFGGDKHIGFDQAFYWASVTATTVGYGDVLPTCDASRIFATGFICVAFLYIANAMVFLGSMPMEIRKLQQQNRVLVQFGESLDADELKALLGCQTLKDLRCEQELDNRFITRTEFALWVLLQADVLDMGWLNKCFTIFDVGQNLNLTDYMRKRIASKRLAYLAFQNFKSFLSFLGDRGEAADRGRNLVRWLHICPSGARVLPWLENHWLVTMPHRNGFVSPLCQSII